MFSPADVANYFIRKSKEQGSPLTQMKLHKLIYFAHGWNLSINKSPLIDEAIEAWDYGPVVPSIYHEFKEFGSRPISRYAFEDFIDLSPISDPPTVALLDRVWNLYGKWTAVQLSERTHEANGPWDMTRRANPGIKGADIPNTDIQAFFERKAASNRNAAAR